MKKFLGVVTLGVALLLGGAPHQVAHVASHFAPTLFAQQHPATTTVYITKTGEKYHRDGCRYLRQSKIATTLRDAVGGGFGPCSVCKPPTMR